MQYPSVRLATVLHDKLRIPAFWCSWFLQEAHCLSPLYVYHPNGRNKTSPFRKHLLCTAVPLCIHVTSRYQDKRCTYECNIEARYAAIVVVDKQCAKYSECVCVCECVCFALVFQQARHMPVYIVICGVLSLHIFSTLSHKPHSFWRKKKQSYWTWNVFWFSVQLLVEIAVILRTICTEWIGVRVGPRHGSRHFGKDKKKTLVPNRNRNKIPRLLNR